MWELDHKESWAPKNWYFWTMVLKKTLESSLDWARRSNHSILKKISPECSLEGLMLKLKLQCCGHLMWRIDSLERPRCWESLKAGGEGDDRGWAGLMASLIEWAWVWANSRSWWWTGKPGGLLSIGSQSVRHDRVTELNWKCCTQYASNFGKLSSGHRTGKGPFSFHIQRKAMSKNFQGTLQLCWFYMLAREWSKSFKLAFNSMRTKNFQM